MPLEATNPAGVDSQAQATLQVAEAIPEKVTPALAASLPYAELKARMRAEARAAADAPATPTPETPGEEDGDAVTEADAAKETAGTARDSQGRFTASASTPGESTTEDTGEETFDSLEKATRVLKSVRGNLKTASEERAALRQQLEEARNEAARLRSAQEEARLQAQHQRFEDLVQRLPPEAQQQARQEYVARLQLDAVREFAHDTQQRELQLSQREFQLAKAELPALYEDIAGFVAGNHGIDAKPLIEFVHSDRVKNLINAAVNPNAVQAVSITLGEMLDEMAVREAGRMAAEKASRREAKAAGAVRDMPTGTVAGGAQEDVVSRINKMDRAQFEAYKKGLLRAHNA